MNSKKTFGRLRRRGVTIMECVAAMGVLVVAIGTVTTWTHRIGRVWGDITDHRVAMAELSSHLQAWTRLPVEEATGKLEELTVSDSARRALPQALLSGEVIRDEMGDRLRLRLQWRTATGQLEADLIGWFGAGNSGAMIETPETRSKSGDDADAAS